MPAALVHPRCSLECARFVLFTRELRLCFPVLAALAPTARPQMCGSTHRPVNRRRSPLVTETAAGCRATSLWTP